MRKILLSTLLLALLVIFGKMVISGLMIGELTLRRSIKEII